MKDRLYIGEKVYTILDGRILQGNIICISEDGTCKILIKNKNSIIITTTIFKKISEIKKFLKKSH